MPARRLNGEAMYTPASCREMQDLKILIGELAVTCLWHPDVAEARGQTIEHEIRAWRESGMVKVEIKRRED